MAFGASSLGPVTCAGSPTEHAPVHSIALTGGPCGGKSSALRAIQEEMKAKGVDVYLVPEVPTIMFKGGGVYPGLDGGQKLVDFETAIIQLQAQMERSFMILAKSTGRPSLLICDRGMLDIAAYLPREAWLNIVQANRTDETSLLGRYDAVIHLVTSADGAEKFYKHGYVKDDSGNDVYRAEGPAEARELDRKVLECWSAHPRIFKISNSDDGFKGKLNRATAAVLDALGRPPSCKL